MKLQQLLLAGSISLAAFTSCKKNDLTKPTGVDYQLQAINSTADISQRQQAGTITWTTATANTTMIKFEAKKDNNEIEFKSSVAQQLNLLAPIASSLGNITLPAGTYSEVEFKVFLNKNGNAPALDLAGTVALTNSTLPVHFIVNEELIIKAEQHDVTITSGALNSSLTTIDLSLLTGGITQSMLSSAQLTNGTLEISASKNQNLYNLIIARLRNSHHSSFHH